MRESKQEALELKTETADCVSPNSYLYSYMHLAIFNCQLIRKADAEVTMSYIHQCYFYI